MENLETAAARLADALLIASVVVGGALGGGTSLETLLGRMSVVFVDLIGRYGTREVDLAAEVVEVAFELLSSANVIEP